MVDACAARREHSAGTWITPEMHAAYCELHAQGHAHSVEVRLDGELVGGLYGVSPGPGVLRRIDVQPRSATRSRSRLARLAERAVVAGLQLIDCQLPTPHLRSLGSKPMSRREFSALVAQYTCRADVPLFSDHLKIARAAGAFLAEFAAFSGATGNGCRKKMRFRWKAKSSRLCLTLLSA